MSALAPVDVLTFGEALGSFRAPARLRMGGGINLDVAGAELNVAIGLARLGHSVRWASKVGADEIGELTLRTLLAERVLVDSVVRDPAHPSALMLVDKPRADQARVQYYRTDSAASTLAESDLVPALAAKPRIVHATGITAALSKSASSATTFALRTAVAQGAIVSFDVNHRSQLWSAETAISVIGKFIPFISVLVASADELPLAAGGETDEQVAVEQLIAGGISEVVVKRGADGATAYSAAGRQDADAFRVSVVDTIGAGDAFTAGYLSAMLDGLDIEARLQRGVAAGACAVGSASDWQAAPERTELERLLTAADDVAR
ncbi:sugar kinase [Lysinibacter cavernae]|uniref:2-dehydro-3-deoxygluconokinase n=1 Tax=Lysinibacter cavernae TaxID=1640652 RepID=A0A7X5QYE6_9MICO|nr:sugar kinase [Lysinibacter cavernae]NIH52273.1 2-dehydro-3-deoxygluconokinase [Lysinibacter cavernae]